MEARQLPPHTVEIIRDKLYFSSSDQPDRIPANSTWLAFSNDPSLVYTAFFADFGPLDLGLTCKFCQQLHEKLQQASETRKSVVYFASSEPQKRSNCATLLLAYLIFVLNYTVPQAYGPFIGIQPPFITFRDAGFCINTFPITVLDNAKAMFKAKSLGHFNYRSFSVQTFQNLAKLQNGDVSWIVPGKFIAFSGPVTKRRQIAPGVYTLTPEQYVPLFKNLGVSCVVRFNDKCYDRKVFLTNGIKHVDLFYEDGGNPSEGILQAFLQICEQERGAIAVHCKAGLGRTGTNIAAYMMKHYGYTAKEATAWSRICRPGCIVGPQQQFLEGIQDKMFQEGQQYREKNRLSLPQTLAIPSATTGTSGRGTSATRRGSGSGASIGSGTGSPVAILGSGRSNKSSTSSQGKPSSSNNNNNNSNVSLPRPNTSGGILASESRAGLGTAGSNGGSQQQQTAQQSRAQQQENASKNAQGIAAMAAVLANGGDHRPKTSHGSVLAYGQSQGQGLAVNGTSQQQQRPPSNASRNNPLRQSMESQGSNASSAVNSTYNQYFGNEQQSLTRNKSKQAWGRGSSSIDDENAPSTPMSSTSKQAASAASTPGQKTSSGNMPPIGTNNSYYGNAPPTTRPKSQAGTPAVSRSLDSSAARRALVR